MAKPKAQTCRQRSGLAFGRCGGKLYPMTLSAGGNRFRTRLWCQKCGLPATDKKA